MEDGCLCPVLPSISLHFLHSTWIDVPFLRRFNGAIVIHVVVPSLAVDDLDIHDV